MQELIIYCHPNPKSLCASLKNNIIKKLRQQKKSFQLVDLYKEKFNPVLNVNDFVAMNQGMILKDVAKHQELIKNSSRMTLIFPLWWMGMPALLKGYIDRVFSYNFAYSTNTNGDPYGMLENYRCNIIVTMGSKLEDYKKNKLYEALIKEIELGIFNFCGINVQNWFICDNVLNRNKMDIERWLNDVKQLY